ncbi:MAG TPA: cytochrome c oxidase assembly factor Coa1 family protein [Methylovirgula sp.]|nr:cytochrome c oxidase assembly factor Coa1 family protein [Methylovirgula sp.]
MTIPAPPPLPPVPPSPPSPPPADPSVLPREYDRWNWGAFLLNWIWGIGNGTYIALLTFIPVFGLIMPFVLGANGNRWAWRNRRWDSLDHFRRVQRAWGFWGAGILIAVIVLYGGLFVGLVSMLTHSDAYRLGVAKLEANSQAIDALGAPIKTGFPFGNISVTGSSGHATLNFSVTGPKGSGRAALDAVKRNGTWSLKSFKLQIDGSDRIIDLLNETTAENAASVFRVSERLPALNLRALDL